MKAADKLKGKYGAFTCLALIKPTSSLASELQLTKPSYCIFEYSPAFAEVQIRWGDGSWQNLIDAKQLDDLILLHDFGEEAIDKLFE